MDATVDQRVARIAEASHGVFGIHQLRELEISRWQREQRLDRGIWTEIHEGVYRISGAPRSWRGDLLAACLAGGTRAAASHRSGAALHDLPGKSRDVLEVTCPRWQRTRHDGLVVHESGALVERDLTTVDGIRVTTVERTIFDLCAVRGPKTIDLAIDNALRRELTTFDRLAATVRRVGRRGLKGTRLMRRLLAERDAKYTPTESEREHMLLDTLRRFGFPDPVRQLEVVDEHGQFVARVDLAYPDQKVAIEYDSFQEHVGNRAHVRDSRRRNAILALGFTVLVATPEDVRYGQGHALASSLRRTLAQSRARDAA